MAEETNSAVISPGKSDCLVWVDLKGCLDIPGIAHGVVSFVSESFLDQHFVDVNFFIAFSVPKININGLIPRPRRARGTYEIMYSFRVQRKSVLQLAIRASCS